MKIKLVKLLLMSCSVIAAACAARRVRDYSFDVTGYVAAEDGSPLQEVEVTLHVDTPVYEALTPVKNQRLVTSKGVFMFRYLSHDPATKYTVTVSKEGFQPQTVSGNAPPDGHLVFRLKTASGDSRRHPGAPNGKDH